MTNTIIEKAKERFAHTHESLAREFGAIRAGRANASLLDRITVEYYGAPTPLNQLASITVPEARVLLISPFDKGSIADIERAINESDLGINPANDGSVIPSVIRLVISFNLSGPITVITAEIMAPTIARTKGTWKPLI